MGPSGMQPTTEAGQQSAYQSGRHDMLMELAMMDPAERARVLSEARHPSAEAFSREPGWVPAVPLAPWDQPEPVQNQALRLIITHCPFLAAQAAGVLGDQQEGGQRQRQLQVNRLVHLALLPSAGAEMEPAERDILARAVQEVQ